MPAADAPSMLYVVQELHWQVCDGEEVPPGDPRPDARPHPYRKGKWHLVTYQRGSDEGGLPVRAFRDPQQAEAFRREREEARRAATNPFRYGGGAESRTSLDEPRLRDWLLDAGLTPPGPEGEEQPDKVRAAWHLWWQRNRGKLPDRVLKGVAQALNNALAGRHYGEPDATGPDDPAWLDEQFSRMDRWTGERRAALRMGLLFTGLGKYPGNDGERDHHAVEPRWQAWWDRNVATMSDYQRRHVWEALDRLRFFEVVELPRPPRE